AVDELMRARLFGDAGSRVVVEEFLEGEEVSFMALTDGTTVLPLATSQDHKRALDGDRGPNTGGMGASSPTPIVTPALQDRIMREIMEPVVRGLARHGVRYTGVLYAGLMVRDGQAKVLEFNVRFGDPEAQALLVRLRSAARWRTRRPRRTPPWRASAGPACTTGGTSDSARWREPRGGRWAHMAERDGRPQVGIVMGSDSDWDTMEAAAERLKQLEIDY